MNSRWTADANLFVTLPTFEEMFLKNLRWEFFQQGTVPPPSFQWSTRDRLRDLRQWLSGFPTCYVSKVRAFSVPFQQLFSKPDLRTVHKHAQVFAVDTQPAANLVQIG